MATDQDLTAKVNKFLTAKALFNATQDPRTQQKAFEDLGLYDDPESHLELEGIYAQWSRQQSKK